jgi:hypothetical protein
VVALAKKNPGATGGQRARKRESSARLVSLLLGAFRLVVGLGVGGFRRPWRYPAPAGPLRPAWPAVAGSAGVAAVPVAGSAGVAGVAGSAGVAALSDAGGSAG